MSTSKLFLSDNNSDTPLIGVVVPFFWTGQSLKLLQGIREAALFFKYNTIFFQGHYTSPAFYFSHKTPGDLAETTGDIVFDLINKNSLDGLIVSTGLLRSYEEKLQLIEKCKEYEPLPIVNIGSAINGISNIVIDNVRGVRKLMNHLIHTHNIKNVAIIRGPENHPDSNLRIQTYLEVLVENNIPIDQQLISRHGTWNNDWVGNEAAEMMKNSGNAIEAFVCLNDGHARAVIEHFKNIGIRVPEDVAVIGFNDEPDAQVCKPSITTIDINLFDRGWYSVKTLHEYRNGKALPDFVKVNAPIIIRQSCGCLTDGSRSIDISVKERSSLSPEISSREVIINRVKLDIMNEMSIPDNHKAAEFADTFISIFFDAIDSQNISLYVRQLSRLLQQFAKDSTSINRWYWVINALDNHLDRLLDQNQIDSGHTIVEQSRVLISEISLHQQRSVVTTAIERNAVINTLTQYLRNTTDIPSLLKVLGKYLPQCGIPSYYMSIYTDSSNPLDKSKLIFAYNQQGRIELPKDGIIFPTIDLIPENLISVEQFKPLVLEPLFYGNLQIGFVLFEFASQEKLFYELFTVQLSAAIWGSILFQKEQETENALKEQAEKLSNANEKLRSQALQLESAYELLKNDHEKLIHSEKMAMLGRLTASIAHEMNTPLAAIRASMMELQKLIREYNESINDVDISREDHREIGAEIIQVIARADKSATQATDFIKSIKIQSRDINRSENERFDIVELLSSVMTFLTPSIKKFSCKTEIINPFGSIILHGSPSKMTQVLTNIISNSLDAIAVSSEKMLTISINKLNNFIIVDIGDTGCGISSENLQKIFSPLFSTKSFMESSGLGLSIVHDIIYKDFGGTIEVISEVNKGTTFTIRIPENKQ